MTFLQILAIVNLMLAFNVPEDKIDSVYAILVVHQVPDVGPLNDIPPPITKVDNSN